VAVYNLSPIFEPGYVPNAAAALAFATPGNPTSVPANYQYQIQVLRVTNIIGAPVTIEIWRVPSGGARGNSNIVVPAVAVPVASQTFMALDLTALWGAVLQTGDAIHAVAGNANALVIQGDGIVAQVP